MSETSAAEPAQNSHGGASTLSKREPDEESLADEAAAFIERKKQKLQISPSKETLADAADEGQIDLKDEAEGGVLAANGSGPAGDKEKGLLTAADKGKGVLTAADKGKGVLTAADKGKGKMVVEEEEDEDENDEDGDGDDQDDDEDDSDDDGDVVAGDEEDSDFDEDPLAEVDLSNILPSRTRRHAPPPPGAYLVTDQDGDDEDDDEDEECD